MIDICLLGASGSIGKQTLDVIVHHPKDFTLTSFSVGKKTRCIRYILSRFKDVKAICIKEKARLMYYQHRYPDITFFSGDEGLKKLITASPCEMVVNALVGFVGLAPSLTALKNDKILALANKESLVVGGELINDLLAKGHGKLIPIDSEHVAIKKCLSVDSQHVKKLILTASGGAFRSLTREELKDVKATDALKHPTWKMGNKITIDCATMINKCFELIEAYYLFNYPFKDLKIILHDESYVHSMVLYDNNTYRLDIGKPDMRVPIKYALYQGLIPFKTIVSDDFKNIPNCHFHDFSLERYPIVKWAEVVIKQKGTFGAVLNAANEVAVNAFLEGQISFLAIEEIVEKCMTEHQNTFHPTYEQIALIDQKTRQKAREIIEMRTKTL